MPTTMEQSIISLMQNLSLNEEIMPTLIKIKAYIINSPSSSFKNVVQPSHVTCLYRCLDTNNKEQIDIVCHILSLLFPIFDPVAVISELSHAIQQCLNHPNSSVKLLALQQLSQIIATTQGSNALSESPEVIKVTLQLIGNDDLSVASAAVKFLSSCGRLSPGIAHILLSSSQESYLSSLKSVMAKSDEIRYRVFELVCSIQSESQEMLELSIQSGIIDELISDISGSDVLLKVSACAMLADVAVTKHGLDYLDQRGVVAAMVELLKNSSFDPLSNLYVPGVVKFFGNLCISSSPRRVFSMFPGYFDLLCSMLFNESDATSQKTAVETIGLIGRSVEGKVLLNEQGRQTIATVERICKITLSGAQDIKLNAINTLCQLLDVTSISEEYLELVSPITLSWFRLISDDPIGSVINLCKLPFLPIRCASFHLLKVIASCEWGVEALVELPFLTEYLLDRTTEYDKECKVAKYEVVETLSASKRCANIFGNRNYLKFRQFVKEGPFYLNVQLNVAFEEAS